MTGNRNPGADARAQHGLWRASFWLIMRRVVQLSFFLLFASGPWLVIWIAKGTLASSMTLGVLPLTDPLIVAQSLAARHVPETLALIGAAIVAGAATGATVLLAPRAAELAAMLR